MPLSKERFNRLSSAPPVAPIHSPDTQYKVKQARATPAVREEAGTEYRLCPPYTLQTLAADTNLDEALLAGWVRSIERKGQAILYGPPGTGKTFVAERLARHLISGGDGFQRIVQFHPAYAYEDFIQGIRPRAGAQGLEYPVVPGRFLEFCRDAAERKGTCVLVIDEINRADLARVFGELMYLLEYRDRDVPLAVSGETFRIPSNVRLLGTMNTADRSIALVDHALRRRFAFLALNPSYDTLLRYHSAASGFNARELVRVLREMNERIEPRYQVGITYFLRPDLPDHLEDIWRTEIESYLEEYFFDQPAAADAFTWERIGARLLP